MFLAPPEIERHVRTRENRDLDHLPGEYGMPVLGQSLEGLRDSNAFLRRMYESYGPVFRVSLFGERRVVLLGPEAAEYVLLDRERNFSSRLGWEGLLGRLFTRGLMLRDFDDHRFHRRILQEAFKKPAMDAYLSSMSPEIARGIADWHSRRDFRFFAATKELTLKLSSSVFLGLELGGEADAVRRAFVRMLAAATPLLSVALPGSALWHGLRGRRYLYDYFTALLPEKRASAAADMFSQLCRARSEDGEAFTDDDVVNHMIFLLFAAHDTTTSALTSMAYLLARHPEWQERLRDASRALGKERLEPADLGRLREIEWVLKEALRLYAPVQSAGRRTVRECTWGGHRIPENAGVMLNLSYHHYLPEWWSEPERFDPERFSDERAEHKRHRFSWIPFGGGAHMCLGLHFAILQVKAIFHQVLLRYRFSLPEGYAVDYRLLPIPRPKDFLPMRIERL